MVAPPGPVRVFEGDADAAPLRLRELPRLDLKEITSFLAPNTFTWVPSQTLFRTPSRVLRSTQLILRDFVFAVVGPKPQVILAAKSLPPYLLLGKPTVRQ